MLDDLKLIHERDAQDALGVAERQWQQLLQEYPTVLGVPDQPVQSVVFAGMGGSALGALMAQSWPRFTVPFEIGRSYDVPKHTNSGTVFFASSYSGNTEETVSALHQAAEAGAGIIVISSGGQLADIARHKKYPLFELPGGLQPRHAVLYSLKALLTATDQLGLTNGAAAEFASRADTLKQAISAWVPIIPTAKNQAKQLALEMLGKSIVVYAGPKMAPAAYKWKINFNENAKHLAWWNEYSEFNHNEFIAWTKQPVEKPYAVIELRSPLEHPQIQKRFEASERLLSGLRPAPHVVVPEGDDLLDQLLWTVALGDFVSLYTALLNGLNPTPVELMERLKKMLND